MYGAPYVFHHDYHSVFSTFFHLPETVPNGEDYKPFDQLYGSETSQCHFPSLRGMEIESLPQKSENI